MRRGWVIVVACLVSAGCAAHSDPYLSPATARSGVLDDETVGRLASGGWLGLRSARLITGNDDAFRSKLDLVTRARTSIDAMYYIYSDDFSSSVLSEALLEAARRGVRVRLLLDYWTNYEHLDLFTMLEKQARGGTGSLEVRFYNRPTRNIVMDAAYLTLGCGRGVPRPAGEPCGPAKLAEIDREFAGERVDGRPAAEVGISNLNQASSGLFLSGLYGKKADLVAFAVLNGQEIDVAKLARPAGGVSAQEKEALKKVGKLYWTAHFGSGFRQLTARLELALLLRFDGKELQPLHEALTDYLPVERPNLGDAARDWEYLTDYLHDKLLLVDGARLQLGGRNVEDSYHMRPNELLHKYMFWDTDLRAELASGGSGVQAAFEALWNFRQMVATTAEVREHAPNDLVANHDAFAAAEQACQGKGAPPDWDGCVGPEFERRALSLAEREGRRQETMADNSRRYWREYRYATAEDPSLTLGVDPGALLAYAENVPFQGGPGAPPTRRSYGARNGEEAEDGKRIHALWLADLTSACRTATAERPVRVILHQAYFFPSSNLIRQFGRMIDGTIGCPHVTVTVLTNSIETTDLNVVNLAASQAAKAFAEYYQQKRNPARSARFEYFEYKKAPEAGPTSLHTKLSVFGGDLLVGSANADVRSYMMDANNGMFIRSAPRFLGEYLRYLDALIADPARTRNATEYFAATPRTEIVAENRLVFRQILQKYRVERWVSAEEQQKAEAAFVEILDRVYALTQEILAGGRTGRADEAEFNRLFKPI
jgi:cardiolipin synthase C